MDEIEIRENGGRVTVSPGQRIVLVVPENATTGYQWSVVELAGPLMVEASQFVPPGSSAPGAGGQRRVTVSAGEPGQGRIVLGLKRPWEDGEPAERFLVEVTVA